MNNNANGNGNNNNNKKEKALFFQTPEGTCIVNMKDVPTKDSFWCRNVFDSTSTVYQVDSVRFDMDRKTNNTEMMVYFRDLTTGKDLIFPIEIFHACFMKKEIQ